jgi:hypothetical protein
MMMHYLAQTAEADFQVSGKWIIALLVAVIPIIGGVWMRAKAAGKSEVEHSRDVTIKAPVPTVRTHEEPEYVTMEIFNGHLARIETSFTKIEEALDSERGIARLANGNIHKRIDALSERLGDRLSNLEGVLQGVATTTGKLLDLALGKKPPTSRG